MKLSITSLQLETTVSIYYQDYMIYGNTQQVLLEQLEQVGIYIPYSCRVGICGFCRIKLVNGRVSILNKTIIKENCNILCCSCIPQTSIQLRLE